MKSNSEYKHTKYKYLLLAINIREIYLIFI